MPVEWSVENAGGRSGAGRGGGLRALRSEAQGPRGGALRTIRFVPKPKMLRNSGVFIALNAAFQIVRLIKLDAYVP